MKIELKNVKYAAFASEETNCFEATVYIDGKREGTASNAGHGGPTEIYPVSLEQRLNAYAATLPQETINIDESRTFEHQPTSEDLIDTALTRHLHERDLKRLLKHKLVILRDGKIQATGKLPPAVIAKDCQTPAKTMATLKAEALLNAMPFDEALALYIKHG